MVRIPHRYLSSMSSEVAFELIGYLGSALVVISLAMSSIIRLRVLNLAGALVFTLYGFLIDSLPILLTNVIIAILNIYYLQRELRTRDELTVIEVGDDDPFLAAFVEAHSADIGTYASPEALDKGADVHLVMMRNEIPAGIFVGRSGTDGGLDVIVDYVSPAYRDYKHGERLYEDSARRFADLGYTTIRVDRVDSRQVRYFDKMGFTHAGEGVQLVIDEAS